jgi:hypothetical protein
VVKIYGKTAAYPFCRITYKVSGKRRIQSFSTYAAAKTAADTKVRELAPAVFGGKKRSRRILRRRASKSNQWAIRAPTNRRSNEPRGNGLLVSGSSTGASARGTG